MKKINNDLFIIYKFIDFMKYYTYIVKLIADYIYPYSYIKISKNIF